LVRQWDNHAQILLGLFFDKVEFGPRALLQHQTPQLGFKVTLILLDSLKLDEQGTPCVPGCDYGQRENQQNQGQQDVQGKHGSYPRLGGLHRRQTGIAPVGKGPVLSLVDLVHQGVEQGRGGGHQGALAAGSVMQQHADEIAGGVCGRHADPDGAGARLGMVVGQRGQGADRGVGAVGRHQTAKGGGVFRADHACAILAGRGPWWAVVGIGCGNETEPAQAAIGGNGLICLENLHQVGANFVAERGVYGRGPIAPVGEAAVDALRNAGHPQIEAEAETVEVGVIGLGLHVPEQHGSDGGCRVSDQFGDGRTLGEPGFGRDDVLVQGLCYQQWGDQAFQREGVGYRVVEDAVLPERIAKAGLVVGVEVGGADHREDRAGSGIRDHHGSGQGGMGAQCCLEGVSCLGLEGAVEGGAERRNLAGVIGLRSESVVGNPLKPFKPVAGGVLHRETKCVGEERAFGVEALLAGFPVQARQLERFQLGHHGGRDVVGQVDEALAGQVLEAMAQLCAYAGLNGRCVGQGGQQRGDAGSVLGADLAAARFAGGQEGVWVHPEGVGGLVGGQSVAVSVENGRAFGHWRGRGWRGLF
jgi:hypothetical protein